jgi:photosystem II stability/assembly factor-like uncharacterized protein
MEAIPRARSRLRLRGADVAEKQKIRYSLGISVHWIPEVSGSFRGLSRGTDGRLIKIPSWSVVASVFVVVVCTPLHAGSDRWTSIGPEGQHVSAIVFARDHPGEVFAASKSTEYSGGVAGVWKSTNGGASWTLSLSESNGVSCLAVDPQDSNVLYACAYSGIYKTTDGGNRWQALLDGSTVLNGTSIAVGADSATVFAATNLGLLKSRDGGANWDQVPSMDGVSIVAMPVGSPSIVFAVSNGFTRSLDGGQNWQPSNAGLAPNLSIRKIVVDPKDPQVLFLTADNGGGVFKSVDGGTSWFASNGESRFPGFTVYDLAIDPQNSSNLMIAVDTVYRSVDGGKTWFAADHGIPIIGFAYPLAIDPHNSLVALAGLQGFGILQTVDAGSAWGDSSRGLLGANVTSLAIDPVKPSVVYASTGIGDGTVRGAVFRSLDGGSSWLDSHSSGFGNNTKVVATDPGGSGVVYACGDVFVKSADSGLTWRGSNGGSTFRCTSISVDPGDPGLLYASSSLGNGFYKSTDQGEHWTQVGRPRLAFSQIVVNPRNPQIIYGYPWQDGSTLGKSSDGGATWKYFPTAVVPGVTNCLTLDSGDPNTLYMGDVDGFGFGVGIFRSRDAGETWQFLRDPTNLTGYGAIVADPNRSGVIYAASLAVVRMSEDGGEHWKSLGPGLSGFGTSSLAITPDGRTLYAGQYGMGVFRYDFADPNQVTLPVAASIHGRSGSFFHSDVRVFNPSVTQSTTVSATYRCFADPCGLGSTTFSVGPRQVLSLDDAVTTLFAAQETGGAIDFEGSSEIVVTSRLYTPLKPNPTVGQFVPGRAGAKALSGGILPGLSHSANPLVGFRSNVGAYNPNDVPLVVTISLYDSSGNPLGAISESVGPKRAIQVSDIFRSVGVTADVTSGYGSLDGDGSHVFFAYASVVDNRSQDPTYIELADSTVVPNTDVTLLVPAVASIHGQSATFFHSDLALLNPSRSTPLPVTLWYRCYLGSCSPGGAQPIALTILPRQQLLLEDVVQTIIGSPETAGTLELDAPQSVIVSSRLYSPASGAPTLGQAVPALSEDDAVKSTVLTSLSNSVDPAKGFRTNVGAFNISSDPENVTFSLFDATGASLGSALRTVQPLSGVQINDLFSASGVHQDVSNAYCTVNADGLHSFLAYASVVDNQSQDPIFVVGVEDPAQP